MEVMLLEYLPPVLVNLVMDYARLWPIRFMAFSATQRDYIILESGTRITRKTHGKSSGWIGFVGQEPFHMSHKTWTLDISQAPIGFWIGIAHIASSSLGYTDMFDVPNESCCCVRWDGSMLNWGKMQIESIPVNTHITFTADTETKTIKTVIFGQETILWNVGNLKDCRPYICLDTYYSHLTISVLSR